MNMIKANLLKKFFDINNKRNIFIISVVNIVVVAIGNIYKEVGNVYYDVKPGRGALEEYKMLYILGREGAITNVSGMYFYRKCFYREFVPEIKLYGEIKKKKIGNIFQDKRFQGKELKENPTGYTGGRVFEVSDGSNDFYIHVTDEHIEVRYREEYKKK